MYLDESSCICIGNILNVRSYTHCLLCHARMAWANDLKAPAHIHEIYQELDIFRRQAKHLQFVYNVAKLVLAAFRGR